MTHRPGSIHIRGSGTSSLSGSNGSAAPWRSRSKASKSSRDSTDPNAPPCFFWLSGYCRRASDCTLRHDSPFAIDRPMQDPRADRPCIYMVRGRCTRTACPYKHQLPVQPDMLGLDLPEPSVSAAVIADMAEIPAANGKASNRNQKLSACRPADLLQRVIRSAISVTFGPGLDIVKVELPTDYVAIILSDLPPNARKKELMKFLRRHGNPVSLEMHRRAQRPLTATATYATHAAASKAAGELDGVYFDTARIRAAASEPVAGPASPLMTTVKLSWDQPTHNAVLGFRGSEFAHRRALAINGRTFDGQRIAAFYQDERQPSVVIPDLPLSADPKGLKSLGRADSITFAAPSYEMGAARAGLRALMIRHGPLESFYVLPRLPGDKKVRAVACFERSEHLDAAVSALHGRRQPCVGLSRVWFRREYSIKYTVPGAQFAVIEQRISDLRLDPRPFTSLRVINPPANSSQRDVILQLLAEEPAQLAQLKAAVEYIANGQVLRDADGRILWDSGFFFGNVFRQCRQSLNDESKVFVTCDAKRRRVNICGEPSDIADACSRILQRHAAYMHDRMTIAIPEQSLRHFTDGGLSALQALLGQENVHLDLPGRVLTFRCSDALVAGIRRVVNHVSYGRSGLADKHLRKEKQSDAAVCPVCLCEAAEPVQLSCGHAYCAACLRLYLIASSSPEASVFPLRCIASSSLPAPPGLPINSPLMCDVLVSVTVIHRLLEANEEAALLDAAFTAHVFTHSDIYRFCPTPDCDQVYRVAPCDAPSRYTCPRCLSDTCTACHIAHPGMTCAHHNSSLVAQAQKPNAIKRCPSGCGALLQKQDGCNHVQCPICKVHMCWICLRMFPNGGVYEHIASVHGEGFMPGVYPADMMLV